MLRRLLGLCLLFEDGQVEVGDEDGCVFVGSDSWCKD